MSRPRAQRAALLLGVAGCLLAVPTEARPVPTGGLGNRWLLSPVEATNLPEGWAEPLHALAAMGAPQRRSTLVPGARWASPSERGSVPWDRLRASGFRVVPGGVSSRRELQGWLATGVDGASGDRPDLLAAALSEADPDGDGRPGDLLAPDGAPDSDRFELRGFAGARGVRPENTLPAFEAAVEAGVSALEVPLRLTRDGLPVPSLDATVRPGKHRPLGRGAPPAFTPGAGLDGPALADLTLAELRARYDRGVALASQPFQALDPDVSPVATAFARQRGWPGPHAYVSLAEAFAFTQALAAHHGEGPGRLVPDAASRARVARRLRWVLDLPDGPRGVDTGRAALAAARAAGMSDRITLQAHDVTTLAALRREAPATPLSLVLP